MNPKLLLCLVLSAFSLCAGVEAQTNGFLVFEVDRANWQEQDKKLMETTEKMKVTEVKQKFKVPLTEEFMSQFKHLPNQNSEGTGFYCMAREKKSTAGGTSFTWWIQRTQDNRWAINMWGQGEAIIGGTKVARRGASQYVTIKHLADLDMTYQLSYFNKFDGINVSFTAKYVPAKEISARGPIPIAPVKKADQSGLFKGDDQSKFPVELRCGFQEN